jgi:hypothetical protein
MSLLSDIITILVGILFYSLSIISIIGIGYSYLKQWSFSRQAIMTLELTLTNPIAILIVKLINLAKYLAIPIIIGGLVWYALYADAVI